MSDEDVIRRRLIIDGDGTGDDRRLNVLLKSFLKWSACPESSKDGQIVLDKNFAQLTQCEYAFTKSRMMSKMNNAELENYKNVITQSSYDIDKAKQDIEVTKEEFEKAKIVRKNRVEYELLANVINEQPDRKKTEEKLSLLRKELQSLKEKSKELDDTFDLRRKQFHVLVGSIFELQNLFKATEPKTDLLDVFDDEDIDILSRKPESDQMEIE